MPVCIWFLLFLCGAIGSHSALQAAEPADPTIHVMSFNIRYGTARDGENAWEHRREFVLETIRDAQPDLLGTQETLAFQRDELAEGLPEYATFGVGREDGQEKGEMMAIFYRTDRFKKLDGGHFWYSETPEVAGSKSWDSSLPRLASWLKLADRQADDRVVYFFNTHFDHRGSQARLESARLLKAKVSEIAGDHPAIVTGDFNSAEGSQPYQALFGSGEKASNNELRLIDTYRQQHPESVENESTAGGFTVDSRSTPRIDWIGCTADWIIQSARINRVHRDGRTPSDHDPIHAVLKWPAQ